MAVGAEVGVGTTVRVDTITLLLPPQPLSPASTSAANSARPKLRRPNANIRYLRTPNSVPTPMMSADVYKWPI